MPNKVAVPQTADELREMLTDRAVMKNLLTENGRDGFASWVEDSIQARLTTDPSVVAQGQEQMQDFMIKWLRDREPSEVKDVMKRLNLDNVGGRGRIPKNTVYNPKALGNKFNDYFDSPAQFMNAISDHGHKDEDVSKKIQALKNSLSSVKPSDGGFLIPEVLRAELLRVALEKAIVRGRARVIPMDSLTVPFPSVDSTSNVGSVFGGVVGFWTEEGATLTESQPRFGRIELRANKLTLYTEVPNELLADAQPSLEAFINEIFPEALAWYEDIAFFVGGGVGEPLGFLNAPARVQVTREASGNAIEWSDIVAMYSRMLPQSLDRAVWVVSPDALPDLLQMETSTGSPVVWLGGANYPSMAASPPMQILGVPMVVSEKARTLGNSGDINLVDFGFYLIGDRQAMSARQSEDFRFDEDKTAFRVIERLDGRPWLQSAITPQNGGPTLSPFVSLAAA